MVVCIDGLDVTERIRSPKVTANARYIASAAKLREKLVEMQRQFASREKEIVSEGRDQGTVAFPDADVKFFLTADARERARRRQAEMRAKDDTCARGSLRADAGAGSDSLEQIQRAIKERDKSDEERAVGPLRPAENAIVVDTTDLSIEEVVEKLLHCVEKNV
jgi:cytidylate kinase